MNPRRKTTWALGLVVAALFGAGGWSAPAEAQSLSDSLSDQWQFSAFLYGYLPQIGGTATFPTGQSVNITVDRNQLINNLKFALMGSFAPEADIRCKISEVGDTL